MREATAASREVFLLKQFPSAGSDNSLSLRGVAKGCFLRFLADVLVASSWRVSLRLWNSLDSSVLAYFGSLVQPYGGSCEEGDGFVIERPGSWFSAMRVCSFLWLAYVGWGMMSIRDAGRPYCLSWWKGLEGQGPRVTRPGPLFADRMLFSFPHGAGL